MNILELIESWPAQKANLHKLYTKDGQISFRVQRAILQNGSTPYPVINENDELVFVKGVYPALQILSPDKVLSEAIQYQVCATKENGDIEYSNWYDSKDSADELLTQVEELEAYESAYVQKRLKSIESEEEHDEGALEKKCPKVKEDKKKSVKEETVNENFRPGMLVKVKRSVTDQLKKYVGKTGRILNISGNYADVKVKGARSTSVEFLLTELEVIKEETSIFEAPNYTARIRAIRQELTEVSRKIASLTNAHNIIVKRVAREAEKKVDEVRRMFFDIQENALDGAKLDAMLRTKYNLPPHAYDLAMEIINTHFAEFKGADHRILSRNGIPGRVNDVVNSLARASRSAFRGIDEYDLYTLIMDVLEEETLRESARPAFTKLFPRIQREFGLSNAELKKVVQYIDRSDEPDSFDVSDKYKIRDVFASALDHVTSFSYDKLTDIILKSNLNERRYDNRFNLPDNVIKHAENIVQKKLRKLHGKEITPGDHKIIRKEIDQVINANHRVFQNVDYYDFEDAIMDLLNIA